jgi:GTP-binding protein
MADGVPSEASPRLGLSPGRVEAGRLLFAAECAFVAGAATVDRLPGLALPEVAFAGRSNVGKSSLINALTGRNTLARTSNTPGRTQQINFFDLGGRLMLVDLPGYGYAQAAKTAIARWQGLIMDYLRGRPNLRRVCLLIDARHGLKATDREVMKTLDRAAVPYRVVLTKADKVGPRVLEETLAAVQAALKDHPAAMPEALASSAAKSYGVAEIRADLAQLAITETPHPAPQ